MNKLSKKSIARFIAQTLGSAALVYGLFLGGIYETISLSITWLYISLNYLVVLLSLILIFFGAYEKLPKDKRSNASQAWSFIKMFVFPIALLMTDNNSTLTAYLLSCIVIFLFEIYKEKINENVCR